MSDKKEPGLKPGILDTFSAQLTHGFLFIGANK